MKIKVYSVYDLKAKTFGNPMFFDNNATALRAWQTAVNDAETPVAKFPEDFTLMELGDFDKETGSYGQLPHPINLGVGSEYVKR